MLSLRYALPCLLFLLLAATARAVEEKPEPFRLYHFLDLDECLEQFKEREFFETMQRRVHTDRTPYVMFMLGLLYDHGLGTPRDTARAAKWYRAAADAGYRFHALGDEADRALAKLLAKGTPSSPPPDAKLRELEEKAKNGGEREQLRLAMRYQQGLCAPLDWEEAKRWEIYAAEQGGRTAQRIVVGNYTSGEYAYPRDPSLALKWLEPLAESGDATAALALGDIYAEGKARPRDYAKAAAWYEKSAAWGNLTALPRLQKLRDDGMYTGAVESMDKVVDRTLSADHPSARQPRPVSEYAEELYAEGVRHSDDDGEAPDYYEAGLLFIDAVGFGVEDPDNHYRLGVIQEEGLAGAPNPYGAGKSFRYAALLGHGEAMLRLARLYEEGRGVRKSLAQAERWYAAAAKAGVQGADERRREMARRIVPGYREDWEKSPEFETVLRDARYRGTFAIRSPNPPSNRRAIP